MKTPISISFCLSDNWAQHFAVVITSILLNNPDEYFVFHVVHHSITRETETKVRELEMMYEHHRIIFHKIDETVFQRFPIPPTLAHITREMYYRYILPDILPLNEERTIYSDVDVLCVKGNIRELFEMDLGGNPIAAIRKNQGNSQHYCEHMTRMGLKPDATYYFSGLFVMDLQKLRTENFSSLCMKKTIENADELLFPDMDVINAVMEGRFADIDPLWNMTERYSFFRNDVKMWHFVHQTQKPWCNLWKNITWIPYLKYLLKTPYAHNAVSFVLKHVKGFFYFSYTKNLSTRYLVCGLRVWKRKSKIRKNATEGI